METAYCALCGSAPKKFIFAKSSVSGEKLSLMKCRGCGLEFIDPRPSPDDIKIYYSGDYFKERTDRGYNNYFSSEIKLEITRVLEMNLADLGFFDYEKTLAGVKSILDIGCAAGYSVEFFKNRGWRSKGIDIARGCVDFAKRNGLDVVYGSYLETDFEKKFDAITLWASIEHLHRPDLFLEKILFDLKPGGVLYISTCKAGFGFKTLAGAGWRFYNFPEHLYFFSGRNIKKLLRLKGFMPIRYSTYGTGFGQPGTFVRKTADRAAKKLSLGDMMIIAAVKNSE